MVKTTEEYIAWKKRKRAKKDATYELRKQKALAEGTRIDFMVCPICGMGRSLKRYLSGSPKFIEATPDTVFMQARYGGGYGRGFFTNEEESTTLEQAKEQYPDHYEALKKAVKHLAALLDPL